MRPNHDQYPLYKLILCNEEFGVILAEAFYIETKDGKAVPINKRKAFSKYKHQALLRYVQDWTKAYPNGYIESRCDMGVSEKVNHFIYERQVGYIGEPV